MKRSQALQYVSYSVTDSLNEMPGKTIPFNARLVGWQCGFEPLFVAVWSYLPGTILNVTEVEEIAIDLLIEKKWFIGDPTPADYIF